MYHRIAGGHGLSGIVLGVSPLSAVTGPKPIVGPGSEIPKLPRPMSELRASETQSPAAINRLRKLPDLRQAIRRCIAVPIIRKGTLVHHRTRIH